MNIKEMRQLPTEELVNEIEKTREKVFRMRFQGKGQDVENPGQLRGLRKDIARLNTVLSERKVRARAAKGAAVSGAAIGGVGLPGGGTAGKAKAPEGGSVSGGEA
jgi:large subunit ribosomal protein L29